MGGALENPGFFVGERVGTLQRGHPTSVAERSSNVESIQHKDVLVVFGQRDNISLRGYLEAAATTHFDVGTLKLSDERRVSLEHRYVKPVAVTVTHKDVTSVTNVNAVGVVGQVLTADTTQKLAFLTEYDHTVTLAHPAHSR